MLSIVVAVSDNNVIGKEQGLVWRLPGDLKKFKELTTTKSKTMIMGRKTFESLPKILPGRRHIILTKDKNYTVNDENASVVHSVDEIKSFIDSEDEYFVIGGGQIFSLLLPYAQKMYLTVIHESFDGDTFFPEYDKAEWKVTEVREGIIDEKNEYKHTFMTLERIN